jgi:CPA2 family monovalent cation:H+ antiporter-2
MGVQAVRLSAGAPLCGRSLAESRLRKDYGVTVVAVRRKDALMASPGPEVRFAAEDIVYLFGKTDKLYGVRPIFAGAAPDAPDNLPTGRRDALSAPADGKRE